MPDIEPPPAREPTSAEIIAFPRAQTDPALRDAMLEEPAARLHRALQMLEAAQADQRLAIARWREAMRDLSGSVQSLGTTLSRYHNRLADAAARMPPPG